MKRVILLASLAFGVAACGHVAEVPDHSFFRMPAPAVLPVSAEQVFDIPIVVGLFAADGLYADRALIHAVDAEARELRQYHYQLWTDPPTRMLQRRLLVELREAAIAPMVIDQLAASQDALRISGVILRFERVPRPGGGWLAAVALKLRADRADGTPFIDEVYRADVVADGAHLVATTDALATAVDAVFAEFHADLIAHPEAGRAR
ncbi:MAG TPA: ABC-type transport auxiliary lipoprotein family protein [Dokdonella sp.]|uniref:ABC-type transport auxiliary lipoprotein family protein n=1 Tax=Dokdonella sp. TaxID=2291710 RepID=UPI0025BB026C|nr:ABC-type transport auxiliary lipoprotein family protein [Dokdonella sp.]MBX3692230.1 membrane integrity-associated transporter subunit PqiC [Dokdonella sp.]HNR90909.1 ABC-type transport auxiliary lipoprotein family protein [Dokdonella sp.]